MRFIDVLDAQTSFSKLVIEAAAGEEVIIAKAGKPVARLIPLEGTSRRKNLGLLQGKIEVADGFNAPIDDDAQSFETERYQLP